MYEVSCKNEECAESIPIPYSNLLERLPYPEAINPDAGSQNLACPECGHVFYYSPKDRRAHYFVEGAPQDPNVRLRVGIIEFDCADEKCGTLVKILLPIPAEVGREYVLENSDSWKVREAYCLDGKQKGHRCLLLPPRNIRNVFFSAGTDDL